MLLSEGRPTAGKRDKGCRFDPPGKIFLAGREVMGAYIHTTPEPQCGDIGTQPADKEGEYPYRQHSWVLLDLGMSPRGLYVKGLIPNSWHYWEVLEPL